MRARGGRTMRMTDGRVSSRPTSASPAAARAAGASDIAAQPLGPKDRRGVGSRSSTTISPRATSMPRWRSVDPSVPTGNSIPARLESDRTVDEFGEDFR